MFLRQGEHRLKRKWVIWLPSVCATQIEAVGYADRQTASFAMSVVLGSVLVEGVVGSYRPYLGNSHKTNHTVED